MIETSGSNFIEPHPSDWLDSGRIRYLFDAILPLTPLLLESNLLDKLLLAWLRHEIVYEAGPKESSELDDDSLILKWCRQKWGHQLETLYLSTKNKLDLVSYRVITVETASLAHELYHRLKANEATFDQLCMTFSVGNEKYNGGKFTDIPLSNFPKSMQNGFASMQKGDLHKPLKNGNTFAVVQLLKYSPASLDQQTERRLLLLQLKEWQQRMIEAARNRLILDG